jgi:hypothetical protein
MYIVFILICILSVICQAADLSLEARIAGREFPSVFQAWNPADNMKHEDALTTLTRHDLVFHGADFFKLQWDKTPSGLAEGFTKTSIKQALSQRIKIQKNNPNMLMLLEIRYRDASSDFLPKNHPWWKRDKNGKPVYGWEEGGYLQLDFANPDFRKHIATQCKAAMQSGVVDGIMLDWWQDDDDRLALIKEIRESIGDKALILANANDRTTPRTAPFINGYFMECYRSNTAEDWQRIATTLIWAEANLRTPHINCLESWYHQSRDDLNLMRATTTMVLTLSDGYCLFSDPNPLSTPDHLHNWYPFWNKSLGKPLSPGNKCNDGSYRREFANGVVIYNPFGNPAVTVTFPTQHTSAATGKSLLSHTINSDDGDYFINKK